MNELYHHGIQGQKWGIRRYQNKDGTLTAAGKRRYNKNLSLTKEAAEVVAKYYGKNQFLSEQANKHGENNVYFDKNFKKSYDDTLNKLKELRKKISDKKFETLKDSGTYKNGKIYLEIALREKKTNITTRYKAIYDIKSDPSNSSRHF